MKKLSSLKKTLIMLALVLNFGLINADQYGNHSNSNSQVYSNQAPYSNQQPYPGYGAPNPAQQNFSNRFDQGQSWGGNGVPPNQMNQPTFNEGPTKPNPNPFPDQNR